MSLYGRAREVQGAQPRVTAVVRIKSSAATSTRWRNRWQPSAAFPKFTRWPVAATWRHCSGRAALAEWVTKPLVASEHLVDTETLIAFRAYSRHDQEAMFEVGLEG